MAPDKKNQLEVFEPYFKTEDTRANTYYKRAFERIETQEGKARTFNFPAVFLGPVWFAYRRMYGIPFLLILFQYAFNEFLSMDPSFFGLSLQDSTLDKIDRALNFGVYAACGFSGTYFYYLSIKKDLLSGRAPHKNPIDYAKSLCTLLMIVTSSILRGMYDVSDNPHPFYFHASIALLFSAVALLGIAFLWSRFRRSRPHEDPKP